MHLRFKMTSDIDQKITSLDLRLTLRLFSNNPLLKQNILKTVLKLIFLTKANKICIHGYSSESMSNDAFHFSVNVTELEFQPRFSGAPLFTHF